MRSPRALAAASFSLALHLALSPAAWAAEPAPENAEGADLKAQADQAFDGRRYADALERYRAAFARGRDPRLHYNIAQALTALERYPEALVAYQAFLAEAPPGTLTEGQQKKLFDLVDEVKAKIARVEIKCDVPGARVLIRDKAVGVTPFDAPIALDAGAAKVEIIAEGFKPFVAEIALTGGTTQSVDARLERVDFTGALVVASNVAGTEVLVDGAPRGAAPVSLRVEPKLDGGSTVDGSVRR
jgi:hypothetical protein